MECKSDPLYIIHCMMLALNCEQNGVKLLLFGLDAKFLASNEKEHHMVER